MRTTLEIDDKVLALARELARREDVSLGRAVSDLALRGMGGGSPVKGKRGVPLFIPPDGVPAHVVTPELVEAYRDEES
jgi:hypothetical protein avisC_06914